MKDGSEQWRQSQVKSGGINIEKIEGVGRVWGGAVPSPLGGLGRGLPPEKNQFCTKIMQF